MRGIGFPTEHLTPLERSTSVRLGDRIPDIGIDPSDEHAALGVYR